MKKFIYIFTILCFAFLRLSNVNAAGSVNVSTTSINVPAGGTSAFNLVLNNAVVRAKILSNDTTVATISNDKFLDVSSGSWLSDNDLKGKEMSYTFIVSGVGSVGDTTTISLDLYDASSFDLDDLSNTYTINVTIVDSADMPPVAGADTYTITYNANGGTAAPSNQTKEENVALTLSTNKPTRKGYEFIGWNTSADGSGDSYEAGGSYTANTSTTLYAQWKEVENVKENPQTGDSLIFIFLAIVITFGGYSYWYTKKAREN